MSEITTKDLLAVIGDQQVQLRALEATVNALRAQIAEQAIESGHTPTALPKD